MELTKEDFQSGLEGVKEYFDEKTGEIKSYVDEKISGVIFYVDEKTHELKNYVDEKFAGVQTQIQVVRDDVRNINTQIEDMKFTMSLSVGAIAAVFCVIAIAPFFKEAARGLRDFFTRPKEDLNAQIENAVRKILREQQGA